MVVNIALAVAVGSRLFPRVSSLDWTILAASAPSAPSEYPVAAALIFRKPSIAATIRHCGIASCSPPRRRRRRVDDGYVFHRHFSLPIRTMVEMRFVDILSGIIVTLIAIAVGMVAVWCLPRLHALMHRLKSNPDPRYRRAAAGDRRVIGGPDAS